MGIVCSTPSEPIEDSSSEENKKDFSIPVIMSIKDSVQENKAKDPIKKEIIVKCSIEEMMKAFFKDYVIVWHDPNANNKENQEYIVQLKRFCEVLTFTKWEKAKDYIKGAKAVCHVVTSGTNGELLVKEIFANENICNVYIFCENKEYHSSWARNYDQKVSCVETDIQNLINQIQRNLLEWYKKASSLNFNLPAFAPIFNDSDKSEMNHLHRYLKIIPNFQNREQAKEDFLALSKAIYMDPNNQKLIANFEQGYNEYQKDHTLRWYTLESFLYKVTNNCLRIATSDSIQYCRLALKDIEQAIKDQYQAKSKNFNGLLYRGAYLSEDEWSSLKENQDKEIEMHGFLSVSKMKKVALNFLKTDPSKKALITIIVPKGLNEEKQGFAEIEEYSMFPQEKEILFNVRSRFTVLETEDKYSGNLQCRHLVLLYGAQGFRKFMNERKPKINATIVTQGNILCARCHKLPEKLLYLSLSEDLEYCKACIDYTAGPFLCIDKVQGPYAGKVNGFSLVNSYQEKTPFYGYKCCNCKGKRKEPYFTCTDCGAAKRWCEKCFEMDDSACMKADHKIILETSPYTFWCEEMSFNEFSHLAFQNYAVGKNNNNIFPQAQMYFESHQYEKAIEFFNLFIQQNEGKDQDADLSVSYNNLGEMETRRGEYKKALGYYLKSLDIAKSVYGGENHHGVATIYNNIGATYEHQGEHKTALEYYLRSLNIRKSMSDERDSGIATCYNNIGSAYKNQKEYKTALEYYFKCLEIEKAIYGTSHPDVAFSYNNIGAAYQIQGEYKMALEYYFEALKISKSVYGENDPNVANSYNNIGVIYNDQEEQQKALEFLMKALEIRQSIYGESHPEVAHSLNSIGAVYQDKGEFKTALEYYLKSHSIWKALYGDNHQQTMMVQDSIMDIQWSMGMNFVEIRKNVLLQGRNKDYF